MENRQVKIGVVISYILIICNALYGLFITPYMISCLGGAEYGVYKTISSLSSSLMVLDLGIGGTAMRYVALYRAKKEDNKIPNFVAMSLIQAVALCVIVIGVSVFVLESIDSIYGRAFTAAQLLKANQLFGVLIISICLHVVENVINGVITGYNEFIAANGTKLVRLFVRIALIILLLKFYPDSLVIVGIDLLLTVSTLIFELIYIRFHLNLRIVFTHWDSFLFKEAGIYTFLMFLTSICAQVNNNLDNVIIGAVKGPYLVTIYSMGLMIFSMYQSLSTSVSGVMLPTMTNILNGEDAKNKTINLIVKVGRVQFLLLGATIIGFACLGREFIQLWLGNGFEDVYIISLLLMCPSLFELCVNVCLSILRAKNLISFRTVVLSLTTLLNAIVTYYMVKEWSYIGAALGTGISFIIGSIVIMNIYYCRKLDLPMIKIYLKIVDRIWICMLIAGFAIYLSSMLLSGGWASFILNVIIFCLVYIVTLWLIGLTKEEKLSIPILKRLV